jgi:hypothetical protein
MNEAAINEVIVWKHAALVSDVVPGETETRAIETAS